MTLRSIKETAIQPFCADQESIITEYKDEKGRGYIGPARKELGVVTLALVREIIAPATFRQEEPEPLTAQINDDAHVRAVANKFKYAERSRGLQILRTLGLGGALPQNRALIPKGEWVGDYLDLSSFLFGESANTDGRIFSATAAAKYSCALSTQPEALCVDSTFHNRANEWGTLYDAINKKNSEHLFDRIFVLPGTLMVQTITFTGKSAPAEVIDFALACLAEPIACGGQTAVTGVNVRTHVAGVYAGHFEKAINSPYVLLPKLAEQLGEGALSSVSEVVAGVSQLFEQEYEVGCSSDDIAQLQQHLLAQIIAPKTDIFKAAQEQVSNYYNAYFLGKRK